jgi:hypothetical protein
LTSVVGKHKEYADSGYFSPHETMVGQELGTDLEKISPAAAASFREGASFDPSSPMHPITTATKKAGLAINSARADLHTKLEAAKVAAQGNPQQLKQIADLEAQLSLVGNKGVQEDATGKPRNIQLTGGTIPANYHNSMYLTGGQVAPPQPVGMHAAAAVGATPAQDPRITFAAGAAPHESGQKKRCNRPGA